MTNFLSNLVDRATQRTSVIRPRPVALFEPVLNAGFESIDIVRPRPIAADDDRHGMERHDPAGSRPASREAGADTAEPAQSASSRKAAATDVELRTVRDVGRRQPGPRDVPDATPPVSPVVTPSNGATDMQRTRAPAVVTPRRDQEPDVSPLPRSTPMTRIVSPIEIRRPPAVDASIAVAGTAKEKSEAHVGHPPSDKKSSAAPSATVGSVATPRPVVQAPAVVPRVVNVPSRGVAAAAVTPPTVVQVTIGQVRAASTSKSPEARTTRPHKPRLSLEDYLSGTRGTRVRNNYDRRNSDAASPAASMNY